MTDYDARPIEYKGETFTLEVKQDRSLARVSYGKTQVYIRPTSSLYGLYRPGTGSEGRPIGAFSSFDKTVKNACRALLATSRTREDERLKLHREIDEYMQHGPQLNWMEKLLRKARNARK